MAYRQSNKAAYRLLLPFFLIIAVVLLLIWRFIISPDLSSPSHATCPEKSVKYEVQPGDTCWDISQTHQCSVETVMHLNPGLDCATLVPGAILCVPSGQ